MNIELKLKLVDGAESKCVPSVNLSGKSLDNKTHDKLTKY